jgi:hypothetical protein
MKRVFLIQCSIIPLLTGLIFVSIVLGSYLNGALFQLGRSESCPLPCWNGIRPGEMSVDAANHILFSQGYEMQNSMMDRNHILYIPPTENRCTVGLGHQVARVTETRLSNCPNLRLGDVIAALGQPDSLLPHSLTFTFARGMARLRLRIDPCEDRLSPFSEVMFVRFARTPGLLPNEVPWQGFIPPKHYEQRFPGRVPLAC